MRPGLIGMNWDETRGQRGIAEIDDIAGIGKVKTIPLMDTDHTDLR
jgi:hypothetical protein